MILDARTRSSFKADKHRAKTASPMRVTGIPISSASMAVHLPVPFWPAESRIFSTMGTPSSSLKRRMSRVISIKNESKTPSFHWTVSKSPGQECTCLGEDVSNLLFVQTQASLQDIVRFRDKLHVTILDTVVDHLDIVSGAWDEHAFFHDEPKLTGLTDPVTAWLAERLSSSLL